MRILYHMTWQNAIGFLKNIKLFLYGFVKVACEQHSESTELWEMGRHCLQTEPLNGNKKGKRAPAKRLELSSALRFLFGAGDGNLNKNPTSSDCVPCLRWGQARIPISRDRHTPPK